MEEDLEGKLTTRTRTRTTIAELLVCLATNKREHNCRQDCAICCPVRSSGEDCRFVLRKVSNFFFNNKIHIYIAEDRVRICRVKDGKKAGRMMLRAFAGKNSSTIDRKEVRFSWDKNCGFFL